MSKVEKFNFSKHLKEIIGNELKQHEFKVKGTRLIRNGIDFIDEIYFQRSQFNAFNENEFFWN